MTSSQIFTLKPRETTWMAKSLSKLETNNSLSHMKGDAYGLGNDVKYKTGASYYQARKTRNNLIIHKTHRLTRPRAYSTSNNGINSEVKDLIISNKVAENKDNSTQIEKRILRYSQICELETLKLGLARVKNKSPGVDGEIKADIDDKRLQKLLKDLKVQKYKPKPNKKVPIPKPEGGVRYLGIASAIDKVVQATIVNLLTPIVEPEFSKYSFGFRPNLGCHDALHHIRYQ